MKIVNQYLGATVLVIISLIMMPVSNLRAQAFTEGFNDITTLTGSGWFMQNNSTPVGSTGWFQGNTDVFSAQSGAATAYIGANFNNTTGINTISNWLLTPMVTISNGDVLSFYTRTTDYNTYPDRLQVRMSTNGASTNVGTGATEVGDFTTMLLEINPNQVVSVYPYLSWVFYTITITGLSAPVTGRFAFRYYVTNGGPSGTNSDYIGIDEVVYTPFVCPSVTLSPVGSVPEGTTGIVYSNLISQTGALGTASFSVSDGSLPPGIVLSSAGVLSGIPTQAGLFNFTISVSSDYNCITSENYSFQVNCPPNPIDFPELDPVCSNEGLVLLNSATPTGGTYSGIGVTNNLLDAATGSQTITYTYTDTYGCIYTDDNDILINTAPDVTHPTVDPVCADIGTITLEGGLPIDGFYEGDGLENNIFSTDAGSQTISYIVVDGNGCSDTAYIEITVFEVTALEAMEDAEICEGEFITLTAVTNGAATWFVSGSTVELTELNVSPEATTEYVVISQNGVCSALSDTVEIAVKNIVGTTQPIAGAAIVCQGQSNVVYSVDPVSNANYYTWTLPNGATGSSTNNEIVVDYGIWAVSGTVTVVAVNDCGEGQLTELEITVNTKPPTPIILQSGNTLISNSANGNQWYNDEGPVEGAETQFFEPEADGNYYVVVTVNGCSSDPSNLIVFILNSIYDEADNSILKVFPNPVNDRLTIMPENNFQNIETEILNTLGQVLFKTISNTSVTIDVENYPQGIYLIKATVSGKTTIIKFIKE